MIPFQKCKGWSATFITYTKTVWRLKTAAVNGQTTVASTMALRRIYCTENCLSFQQTDDTQRDDISYFESQDKSDEWSLKVSSLTISEMGDRRTLNDVESVAVGVGHYY